MRLSSLILFGLLLILTRTTEAANECRIQYKYKVSGKETTRYLYINRAQTKTVNANHLVFVKNLKDQEVRIWVGNYNVKLAKNGLDPVNGFHMADVKLKQVQCLNSTTNQPLEVVLQQYKQAGKSAFFIASHLKNTMGMRSLKIAEWLDRLGFVPVEIIRVLKRLGYSIDDIGSVILNVLKLTADRTAQVMEAAGYTYNQVARVLENTFNLTSERVAELLNHAGYRTLDIARYVFSKTRITTVRAFTFLKTKIRAGVDVVIAGAKHARRNVSEVASAAKSTYNLTISNLEAKLRTAGYRQSDISRALEQFRTSGARTTAPRKVTTCPKGKRMVNGVCR